MTLKVGDRVSELFTKRTGTVEAVVGEYVNVLLDDGGLLVGWWIPYFKKSSSSRLANKFKEILLA